VFESDQVSDTIDYEQVALKIRSLAASGHSGWWRPSPTDRSPADRRFRRSLVKVSASKIGVLANARFVGVSLERGKRYHPLGWCLACNA